MWSLEQYEIHVRNSWERYKSQDGWFKWGNEPEDAILAGHKMYRCVSQCDLFPLLGDYKIRSDQKLLQSFGLASGSGVSTADDQKLVDELDAARKKLGPQYSSKAVAGSGSILNDIKWTPLLNDSFILAGIHRGKEFNLALEDVGKFFGDAQARVFPEAMQKQTVGAPPNKQSVFGAVAPKYAAPTMHGAEYYRQVWKIYLQETPNALWNATDGCPRVFARELMGLKTFGYFPDFNYGTLGFAPPSTGAAAADFTKYLTALDDAGFPKRNKSQILAAVSEFLFEDAKALA